MMYDSCVVMEVNIKLGFFICLLIVIQKCSADASIVVGEKGDKGGIGMSGPPGLPGHLDGAPGEKGDRGRPGYSGFPGLIGRAGLNGEPGAKGDEGNTGDKGERGLSGIPGVQGLPGKKGDKGEGGLSGIPGMPGPPGDDGPVGIEGPAGPQGEKGDKGGIEMSGTPGRDGLPGRIGPSGLPGKDGVCTSICYKSSNDAGDMDPPEGIYGTIEFPSDVPCNVQKNKEGPFTGKIWVHPLDKFEVECKERRTCLLTNPKGSEHIEKVAFHSSVNQTKSFWLSNSIDFDLTKFYGITMKQIYWLQHSSTKVTQTIRYHCKNSYVMENSETELILLSANDVIIRPHASDVNPIAYAMLPNATHDCKEGASKFDWFYSDITVRGNTRRLPVIDFLIRDNRKEHQSFFIELVELCFS